MSRPAAGHTSAAAPSEARPRARWLRDIVPQTRSDVRLLGPACVAWAAVAAVLGAPGWAVASIAVGCVATGVLLVRRGRAVARRQTEAGHPPVTAWARARPTVALALLLTGLVLLALLGHRGVRGAGSVDELAAQRGVVTMTAEVASDPRRVGGGSERRPTTMVRLRVTRVEGRGSRSRVSTPVLAFAAQGLDEVRWGEQVRLQARLAPVDRGDDVAALAQVRGPTVRTGPAGPVARAAEHIRSALRAACQDLPDDAGLVPALVVGDTSLTPEDLTADMTAVQMSHLSAVSGSNVSVVLAAVTGLAALAGLRRRWRPAVALVALAGFVVLARPEPSVVRAAAMGAVGLVGISTHRRRAAFPALAGAVVGLLVYDPWLSRSFGFALSTLATLGLLLFATPWGEAVGRRLPAPLRRWGPALAVPLAAQVMCGPVTVLLQPGVSLVGVPANLAAAPFVGPTTILGIVTALVAVVSVPVAHLVAWAAAVPALAIAKVARVAADVPHGAVPWPGGAAGASLLALVTLVVLLAGARLAWWGRSRPLATVCVLALGLALVWPTRDLTWPVPGWTAVVCDVGQGDGIVLASGEGRAVVVDVGPPGPAMRDCLSRLEVRALDAVVVTHYHDDHSGGLPEVLDGWPVGELVVTATREPAGEAQRVDRLAREHRLTPVVARAGDLLTAGAVRARVLGPSHEIRDGSLANNASLVLLVDAGGTRLLLTGDVEPAAAAEARRALPPGAGVDVLKVAHHGSAKQDPRSISDLGAPLALISVGADNDYGHPAASALRRLDESGYRVARTDHSGDLAVLGHGPTLRLARRGR